MVANGAFGGARRRQVTTLLLEWTGGDTSAIDELLPLVYDELRRLARHQMSGERKGHVLQATALVNEAFLRLVDIHQIQRISSPWPRG
jgi:DNA-directed RNA polymerase specialized sigma24 family protein